MCVIGFVIILVAESSFGFVVLLKHIYIIVYRRVSVAVSFLFQNIRLGLALLTYDIYKSIMYVKDILKGLWTVYYIIEDYARSEEHTSELQSLMRLSNAVFCLKKKITIKQ